MIDRGLLKDMGFVLGRGWDHEVWVYDGCFLVHYDGTFSGLPEAQADGNATDRRTFFKMFMACIVNEAVEAATYCEHCD